MASAGLDVSVTISGVERLFGSDFRGMLDVARMADDAGIDQIVLPDHVVMGTRTDRYPFGTFPYPPEEPWPEPLTTLAAIAAVTTRVRLGTGILIAPLRPAPLLAKTAATLDVLSGGRLDLGVGSGWQREEFEASDLPFAGRTQRMDDTVRACQALWRECPATFSSPTISFEEIYCEPSPVQAGGIPVWFGGGGNQATAARVAEMGAGWLPVAGTPDDELTRGIELMRTAFAAAGRDPASAGVRVGLTAARDADGRPSLARTVEAAAALEQAGVSMVSVALGRFVKEKDAIAPFLTELGAAFGG